MPNETPRVALLVLTCVCALATVVFARASPAQGTTAAETGSAAAEGPEVASRFSGVLRPKNATGVVVALNAEMKEWRLHRSSERFAMPEQGFYLAHLVAGEITAEIAGKSITYHPGDFWVVEKGQRMALSMARPRESAILQTLALNSGH